MHIAQYFSLIYFYLMVLVIHYECLLSIVRISMDNRVYVVPKKHGNSLTIINLCTLPLLARTPPLQTFILQHIAGRR